LLCICGQSKRCQYRPCKQTKRSHDGARLQKDEAVFVNQGQTQRRPLLGPYQGKSNSLKFVTAGALSSTLELRLSDLTAWPALQDKITQLWMQRLLRLIQKAKSRELSEQSQHQSQIFFLKHKLKLVTSLILLLLKM